MRFKGIRLIILNIQIRYLKWRIARNDKWLRKSDPHYAINKAKLRTHLDQIVEDVESES